MKPNITTISKFLSLVLRHKPETIGLVLDKNGWADTQELLKKMSTKGPNITLEVLQEVVETNSKKRFAFNEDGSKIRASQGHSLSIDLGYQPSIPPTVLYHGTATRFLNSIKEQGLIKGQRDHVHLSIDTKTATSVGSRHGKVVILEVLAKEMQEAGYEFFVSENGVWLTGEVPVKFLSFPS